VSEGGVTEVIEVAEKIVVFQHQSRDSDAKSLTGKVGEVNEGKCD